MSKEIFSKIIVVIFTILLLALLGQGVARKTRTAVAPPIYDPIGYYSKSELVWKAINKKEYIGAMNWFPYRPPGSSLILYPTGFQPSLHSFLFRSVFARLVIWSIALLLLIVPWVRRPLDAFVGAALITASLSLPIFYHFQKIDYFLVAYKTVGNEWGLVDPLQGAVAALGVGFIVFGISRSSLILCVLGWISGAYTLFIKPSGTLVMGALLGIAFIELFIRFYREADQRRSIVKFGAFVLLASVVVYGSALYLAFNTDYLGKDAIAKGLIAQKIDIGLHDAPLLFKLYLFIQPVIGWWWFIPLAAVFSGFLIEGVRMLLRRDLSASALKLVMAAAICVASIWWWANLAGMEHRFLFPILLMLMAWFAPDIFQRLERLHPKARKLVISYCLIPFIALIVMLHCVQPDLRLQKFFGVNLTNDQYKDEVQRGKWLIGQAESLQRPLRVYCMGDGIRVGVVEMVDWVKSIEHGNRGTLLNICRPNTWIAHPGLKVKELVASDFLLMEGIKNESKHVESISNWTEEPETFKEFVFSQCGIDKNGLELVFDGDVKILRVADATRFADAIYAWAQSIRWLNDFPERNKEFLEKHRPSSALQPTISQTAEQ